MCVTSRLILVGAVLEPENGEILIQTREVIISYLVIRQHYLAVMDAGGMIFYQSNSHEWTKESVGTESDMGLVLLGVLASHHNTL